MTTISGINYFRSSCGSVIALPTKNTLITKSLMTSNRKSSRDNIDQQKKKNNKPVRD